MTTPFWCLLVACVLPILLAFLGGYYKTKQFGTLDNKNPRRQAALLEGTGARVASAQANAWEALACFAPAVLVNHVAGGEPGGAAMASLIFIAARVLHAVFYMADLDPLRSLSFLVATGAWVALFVMAA